MSEAPVVGGADRWLIGLDTTSPLVSVAVGTTETVVADRAVATTRSSAAIMELLDACLKEAGLNPRDISGMVVLRGPGSFTGIRIGLALAQGLRQALGISISTLPTFSALAASQSDHGARINAAVQAGRREWLLQAFAPGTPPRAHAEPWRCSDAELVAAAGKRTTIGFGLDRLIEQGAPEANLIEPPALARQIFRLLDQADDDPRWLTDPLYMAAPPADPRARVDGGTR